MEAFMKKAIIILLLVAVLFFAGCASVDYADAHPYYEMSEYEQGVAAVQAHAMFWIITGYLAWAIVGR